MKSLGGLGDGLGRQETAAIFRVECRIVFQSTDKH